MKYLLILNSKLYLLAILSTYVTFVYFGILVATKKQNRALLVNKTSDLKCRKMLIPMPAPLGLVFLGKCYMWLTSFCFVSMGYGINQTDGLDGLAGGTAALAFIGMAIAVLPISSG